MVMTIAFLAMAGEGALAPIREVPAVLAAGQLVLVSPQEVIPEISLAPEPSSKSPIPKKIHYCWFGGPMPAYATEVIESWKKHMPDFEIVRWDETNCDVESNAWTKDAYKQGQYAFVSDYCRLKALYEQGGLYLDTDHLLKKPVHALLTADLVLAFQTRQEVSASFVAARPRHPMILEIMRWYEAQPYWDHIPSPNVFSEKIQAVYPDFSNHLFLYRKGSEIVIWPTHFVMLDFGGEENFAVHQYANSSYGSDYFGYWMGPFREEFLNNRALRLAQKNRVTRLLPTLETGIFRVCPTGEKMRLEMKNNRLFTFSGNEVSSWRPEESEGKLLWRWEKTVQAPEKK